MDDRLASFCVSVDATVRSTMEMIDFSGAEIALVIDDHELLVGTVSDGDLRRALLNGARMSDAVLPFVNRSFRSVGRQAGRAEVLDLMQACLIAQIPVLDDEGHLIGAHLLKDVIGGERGDVTAVIMAGGEGLRLRPLTETVPKPMLLVAGRPILERIVLHLVGGGVRRIFIAINYRSEAIEAHFASGEQWGCHIQYLREEPDRPLGTAGALGLLPPGVLQAGRPILVMNGDLITQFDVDALIRYHLAENAAITIGVRPYTHQIPYGVVETAGGKVQSVTEKPTHSWMVNAGVYALDVRAIGELDGMRAIHMTDIIAGAIGRQEHVTEFPIDGDWADIGRADELNRARGLHP